jgi:hypothetical protein
MRMRHERTCIWWPYSCQALLVSVPDSMRAAVSNYLEANLAQVAQCPHKRRHGGVICLVVVRVGCSSSIDDAKHSSRLAGLSTGHAIPVTGSASKLQEVEQSQVTPHLGFMMIVRSLIRVQAPKIASKRILRIPNRPIRTARRYSTADAPSMTTSTPQSQASMLATITTDLDNIAPRFEIQPEQITIIKTPADFYETLKVGLMLRIFSIHYFTFPLHILMSAAFANFSLLFSHVLVFLSTSILQSFPKVHIAYHTKIKSC